MKIIQLSYDVETDSFLGVLDDDETYYEFTTDPTGEINRRLLEFEFHIRNYEHFVGVMSKFNPWSRFLANPIPINELTLEALHRVRSESPYIK